MTYNYLINGKTPAKKNSRINLKNGVSIPSKRYSEWHKSAIAQLRLQTRPFEPIDYPVFVYLKFTHGDQRRRDSDNGCSSIMDLLTDSGVLKDDNWKIVREIKIVNAYEKNEPKCEVMIQLIED